MSEEMNEELNEQLDQAPGWDAIDEALKPIYGDQEPKHYGTLLPYSLGGQDPLDGISAYKSEQGGPHWHIVTYGFSELYTKESENLEDSGFGFELTFRVARTESEEEPPAWALNLLQNMGRYVFGSGNIFKAGDYLDANGPICLGADTLLTALAFTHDPQLSPMDTPNGRVEFIQMAGITGDELDAMMTWNTLGVLSAGLAHMPYYITDLSRSSLLDIQEVADAVNTGLAEEGSSTGFLFVDTLDWMPAEKKLFRKTPARLTIGAKQAGIVGRLLQGRILKGKTLRLLSENTQVVFEPGEKAGCKEEEANITITLNEQAAAEFTQKLVPKESSVPISSVNIVLDIIKTLIRDSEGSIVETIG